MPWMEASTVCLRQEFVSLAIQPRCNLAALCRRFAISRKTAYKWMDRAKRQENGVVSAQGMADRSRRPLLSPGRTAGSLDMRLDRLMAAYIDRVVTLPEYKTAKNKMMDEKRLLAENLTSVEKQRNTAFEPLKSYILAIKQAKTLGETGKPEEQRDFFKTITSNPNVFNRELRFEPRGAWQLVIRQGSFAQHNTAPALAGAVFLGKTRDVVLKRRGGETASVQP